MINFKKKLLGENIQVPIDPIEIYNKLDRQSDTGPLRPIQNEILTQWYQYHQEDRDLIIKLHTGEGKTLIGLLTLQSKINQKQGPCVFISPNKYLSEQVAKEAEKFGIPYCLVESNGDLPDDFLNGKKILITYVQKLFNGKSKFGIDTSSVPVGSILLDDSHACIDSIRDAFTVRISKEDTLFQDMLFLFQEALRGQGEGSFLDINRGDSGTLLPIPYWSWIDKSQEVTKLFLKYSKDSKLSFIWPIIRDHIEKCEAFVTGEGLEISPYNMPINRFRSFSNANQRILMSATTQEDSFFIKGLGFSPESIRNPLTSQEKKWFGEKMILIPSLIDESLNRGDIIDKLTKPNTKCSFGRVVLVPSKRISQEYERIGACVANTENISQNIYMLKQGRFDKALVLVNRYDGIDLPDISCRILIIDSMPYLDSLVDRYEGMCRPNSDLINMRRAQKVEQGLGRSVRGEKDFSIIVLLGADLVKFVKSNNTSKYFSAQTKKQIDIGIEVASMAKKENIDCPPFQAFVSVISQVLKRDDGWKEYYAQEMDTILEEKDYDIYDILDLEKQAEEAYHMGNCKEACDFIQNIINSMKDPEEKGWYLQVLARYLYKMNKLESQKTQKKAFESNNMLLKPLEGIIYKKLPMMDGGRIGRIKTWLSRFKDYQCLWLHIEDILTDCSFGVDSEKFELSLMNIGLLLGFLSQRPDREIKKGPDNLWRCNNSFYFFECKNTVNDSRKSINKDEAGQMCNHYQWFKTEYESEYNQGLTLTPILVIPTSQLSYNADLPPDIVVMRRDGLELFKENIRKFIRAFERYDIRSLDDNMIHEQLDIHNLNHDNLMNKCVVPITRQA